MSPPPSRPEPGWRRRVRQAAPLTLFALAPKGVCCLAAYAAGGALFGRELCGASAPSMLAALAPWLGGVVAAGAWGLWRARRALTLSGVAPPRRAPQRRAMPAAPRSANPLTSPLARAIVWSGLAAGALDLVYVCGLTLYRGGNVVALLQGIAAALFGPAARNPVDWGYAIVGVLLHFAIAFIVAALFCMAAKFRPYLVRQPGIAGPLYGVAVWLTMQLIFLPLTRTPPKTFPPANWEPAFLAHLLCVGLPIALIAARFLAAPAAQPPAAPDVA